MPEPVLNVTPAPAGSPAPSPAGSTPAAGVTLEQVQAMLNPLFAKLRKLEESGPLTPNPSPSRGEGSTPAATPTQEKLLADRVKAAEDQLAKGAHRLRTAALKETAAILGVPADRFKMFELYVESEHGKAIKLNEHDQPVHVNELEQVTPLKDFLVGLLKTPAGEMFKPAMRLPNVPGGSGQPPVNAAGKRYEDLTLDERLTLKPDEERAMLAGVKVL